MQACPSSLRQAPQSAILRPEVPDDRSQRRRLCHPISAAAYATIKQNLAARFPDDQDAYYDIKDPVFDLIMAAAEPWAQATQWTIPASD